MEQRRPREYTLDVFADPAFVKDVVKGNYSPLILSCCLNLALSLPCRSPPILLSAASWRACRSHTMKPLLTRDATLAILHTIFFHRYFSSILPLSRDLLDLTLPAIDDVDLETLIDQRTLTLVRAIESHPGQPRGRGQLQIQFFEKKASRRRTTYFPFGSGGRGADEEICWETWTLDVTCATPRTESDVIKVRRAMKASVRKAALKIVEVVNRDKDHIPAITTTEGNPFPYKILVNPKNGNPGDGWGGRMGVF